MINPCAYHPGVVLYSSSAQLPSLVAIIGGYHMPRPAGELNYDSAQLSGTVAERGIITEIAGLCWSLSQRVRDGAEIWPTQGSRSMNVAGQTTPNVQ